jgi:hypothetical protein
MVAIMTPKGWDAFLSYAREDEGDVAVPLAGALQRAGLRVWLDRQVLKVGDPLLRRIQDGLADSRYGIPIISRHFLAKEWPQKELEGMMVMEDHGSKVILPVWHDISSGEIAAKAPVLAARLAARTTDGLERVTSQILEAVYSSAAVPPVRLPSSRLLDLIESMPSKRNLLDFLKAYPRFLADIYRTSSTPVWEISRGGLHIDALLAPGSGGTFIPAFHGLIFTENFGNVFSTASKSVQSTADLSLDPLLQSLIEQACSVLDGEGRDGAIDGRERAAPPPSHRLEITIFAGRRTFIDYTNGTYTAWSAHRDRLRPRRCNIWSYDALVDEFRRVEQTWMSQR